MRRLLYVACVLALLRCGSEDAGPAGDPGVGGTGGTGGAPDASATGGSGGTMNPAGGTGGTAAGRDGGPPQGYPDGFTPDGAPPKIGEPGCGFERAAFCDTFEGPSHRRGRAGELDSLFWSAGRNQGQLSTERAFGIGMAVIPECRPGMPTRVWPDSDTLICNPTADIVSQHLLVGSAAQNYGQNGYRIRQPFDFAGRTGKIVFDAAVNLLSGLHGWVSLAITEDPISVPGYAIRGNDEGSILPRNGIEVHFVNVGYEGRPGQEEARIGVRNVHIFRDHADTVYEPDNGAAPLFRSGKLHRFEFLVSEQGIEITISPYSPDGVTFAAPEYRFEVDTTLPLSRGWVHVNVHNHAMLKYTHSDDPSQIVDATVAQIDNVGFDGPVIGNYREYEVPDALVEFTDPGLGDPHNTDNKGYDIGWIVGDEAEGPKQVLKLTGVDPSNAASATLAFTVWVNASDPPDPLEQFTFRARVNGKRWLDRKFTATEAAFLRDGPTVVDKDGNPYGEPASQGRLALTLDVPLEDLVSGDNTLEFVTANVPTSYPPLVANVDLVLQTR